MGNVPPPRLFFEPFCGGATTALRLAGTGVVQHVVLADADELVAAFWKVAAFETTWLIEQMDELEVTVARWKWWRAYQPTSERDMALKCLFLNRTTFSGILHGHAGPIGGMRQDSTTKYPIDCRFNKGALAERIRAVGELAGTGRLLDVWNTDWKVALARMRHRYGRFVDSEETLVYLDPPYVEKAPFLYQTSFDGGQHRELAEALSKETPYRWLLSYDDNPLARQLYSQASGRHVLHTKHRYTAAGLKSNTSVKRRRTVRAELLVTNFPDIPQADEFHFLGDKDCESCSNS